MLSKKLSTFSFVFFQTEAIEKYFKEEIGADLPQEMWNELNTLKKNIQQS